MLLDLGQLCSNDIHNLKKLYIFATCIQQQQFITHHIYHHITCLYHMQSTAHTKINIALHSQKVGSRIIILDIKFNVVGKMGCGGCGQAICTGGGYASQHETVSPRRTSDRSLGCYGNEGSRDSRCVR